YNNQKIYETGVKGSSNASQNSQNVAFMSSNSSNSTSESVKTGHGVSATHTQAYASNSTTVDSLSNAVIYSFFANQSNNTQLDNKDLEHIDANDLEEMDLKWKMAKLT
ncbi:hypothetical protein Tco_0384476, partial [Tanacetum coccineum]